MKKIDVLRQRNIQLSEQVRDLEQQLNDIKNEDKHKVERADMLVELLHETQDEYSRILNILYKQQEEYDSIISQAKEMKFIIKQDLWQMVRYLLFNKIKRIFHKGDI